MVDALPIDAQLLNEPLVLLLIGLVIVAIVIVLLKYTAKIFLEFGETGSFILACLSFALFLLIIILKITGVTGGLEDFMDPVIYPSGILFIITLGIYLLFKVFPK